MYEAASVLKNKAQFATSSALPNLLIGKYDIIDYSVLFPDNFVKPSVDLIIPGLIPFTRTPLGPN